MAVKLNGGGRRANILSLSDRVELASGIYRLRKYASLSRPRPAARRKRRINLFAASSSSSSFLFSLNVFARRLSQRPAELSSRRPAKQTPSQSRKDHLFGETRREIKPDYGATLSLSPSAAGRRPFGAPHVDQMINLRHVRNQPNERTGLLA